MVVMWCLIGFSLFFSLDGKETKGQGCIFFAKIRLVAEGAETRFAQTTAPSSRYNPPDFFTQKKRGRSFWFLNVLRFWIN
jgi:hypothetical protein